MFANATRRQEKQSEQSRSMSLNCSWRAAAGVNAQRKLCIGALSRQSETSPYSSFLDVSSLAQTWRVTHVLGDYSSRGAENMES